MKVTIRGDLSQVSEAMGLPSPSRPMPRVRRLAQNKAKREEFVARRKEVVDAFKLARASGAVQEMGLLLEAIRRTGGVTDGDLKLARVINRPMTNGDRT